MQSLREAEGRADHRVEGRQRGGRDHRCPPHRRRPPPFDQAPIRRPSLQPASSLIRRPSPHATPPIRLPSPHAEAGLGGTKKPAPPPPICSASAPVPPSTSLPSSNSSQRRQVTTRSSASDDVSSPGTTRSSGSFWPGFLPLLPIFLQTWIPHMETDNGNLEDDRDVVMTEDDMYAFLGLRDDDAGATEMTNATPFDDDVGFDDDAGSTELTNALPFHDDCVDQAAIPVDDDFVEETCVGYDMEDPDMKVGLTYPTMDEFRMALKQYAIKHQFDIRPEKSDTTRFRGTCRAEGCEWRIVAAVMPDKRTIRISKMIDNHTCVSTSRGRTSMATRAWVAKRSLRILRKNPSIGAKELQNRLQDQYNVTIPYRTVWGGRERAIEELYCPWEDSFHMLHKFKAEVLLRSPESIVEIDTKMIKGETYFHRFFIAFKPCIDGFINGCRPYLSIDSTALNGRWNGHLAAVTALDGHNWMFPVAFGFIESESADNWTWFMEQLKKGIGDPPVLAVCTDACKGLENAVKSVFPNAEQRECFRHLMLNFVKKFHGDVFGHMWPAAKAYKSEKFDYHMSKIIEACSEVEDYLNRHHSLLWMRSKFSTEIKCDYINNNLAECFNNWIKDIKDLPVVDLADKLHEKIMVLFHKRRRISMRLEGHILLAIVHQLNKKTRALANMTVKPSANHSASIIESNEEHQMVRHVVKLLEHECTCREWQLTGKPCSHALAFITTERNIDMGSFVHEYYSVSKFKAAYNGVLEPMTDKSQWPEVDPGYKMLPPLKKRSSGRPRKLRIPNFLEKGGVRRQHKCKQCGELGHHAVGCPLNGPKKRKRERQSNVIRSPKNNRSMARTTIDSPGPVTRSMARTIMDSPGPVTRSMATTTMDSPGPVTRSMATTTMDSPRPAIKRQLAMTIGEEKNGSQTPPRATSSGKTNTSKKLTPRRKKN